MFGDVVLEYKMVIIVDQYESSAVKEKYKSGFHFALVDAWSLASLLISDRLVLDFNLWMDILIFSS